MKQSASDNQCRFKPSKRRAYQLICLCSHTVTMQQRAGACARVSSTWRTFARCTVSRFVTSRVTHVTRHSTRSRSVTHCSTRDSDCPYANTVSRFRSDFEREVPTKACSRDEPTVAPDSHRHGARSTWSHVTTSFASVNTTAQAPFTALTTRHKLGDHPGRNPGGTGILITLRKQQHNAMSPAATCRGLPPSLHTCPEQRTSCCVLPHAHAARPITTSQGGQGPG